MDKSTKKVNNLYFTKIILNESVQNIIKLQNNSKKEKDIRRKAI